MTELPTLAFDHKLVGDPLRQMYYFYGAVDEDSCTACVIRVKLVTTVEEQYGDPCPGGAHSL